MGEAREPEPVNLICGLLAARPEWLDAGRRVLADRFGTVELASDIWPFDSTTYYEAEMGGPLLRQMVSFEELMAPGDLAGVKQATNGLEVELSETLSGAPPRPVNLDPGYVSLSKLVLATTKDYAHRVYLGDGIYAESTLHWHKGGFEPWPWTYPDYRTEACRAFFARVRSQYETKLHRRSGG